MVVVVGFVQREPLGRFSTGVNVQQLRGRIAGLFGGATLRLRPLIRTQPMQWCRFFASAGVARNQMQGSDRHVELGFVGVLDGQELGGMVVDGQGFETAIAPHAVVDVNHRRADVEFDQVLDDQIRIDATALGAFHGGFGAMPEDVCFGNDSMFRQPIAALDGRDGYRQLALALLEGCEILDIGGAQPFALQELLQMRLAA